MQRRKAYSYVRFSTLEQERGDSQRRQIEAAREYARKKGLELDGNLTFHDPGVSAYRGRNIETGRLGEFLNAVRLGLVPRNSFLLVESLDRISRNAARKAFRVLEDICEEGITVVTLSDGREYTKDNLDNDAMSLMMALIIFIRANEESALKGRRLKASWDHKRANATKRPLTSLVPGWVKLEGDKLALRPERAAIVRRVFRMTLNGEGQHAIAETFNREKIPTFGRARYWHRSYIKKLLANPAVTGTLTPHELQYSDGRRWRKPLDTIADYYPRVIDQETFDRIASMRVVVRTPRARRGKLNNLLGGLARCPINGATMTRVSKGRSHGKPMLVCVTAKAGAGCIYHAVPQERVEAALIENIQWLASQVPSGSDDLNAEMEQLDNELVALSEGAENIVNALRHGPSQTLARELRKIEAERDRVEARKRDLGEKIAASNGPITLHKLQEARAALSGRRVDRMQANSLLRQIFNAVTVDWRRGQLVFAWKQGGETEITFGFPHEVSDNTSRRRTLAHRRRGGR